MKETNKKKTIIFQCGNVVTQDNFGREQGPPWEKLIIIFGDQKSDIKQYCDDTYKVTWYCSDLNFNMEILYF